MLYYNQSAVCYDFICEILRKRPWFVKYMILKQTRLIWNAAKTGYQYTFACKQMHMFIEWMSEDSTFIKHECWTIFIVCQTKKILKNTFILFIFRYVSSERRKKKIFYSLSSSNLFKFVLVYKLGLTGYFCL